MALFSLCSHDTLGHTPNPLEGCGGGQGRDSRTTQCLAHPPLDVSAPAFVVPRQSTYCTSSLALPCKRPPTSAGSTGVSSSRSMRLSQGPQQSMETIPQPQGPGLRQQRAALRLPEWHGVGSPRPARVVLRGDSPSDQQDAHGRAAPGQTEEGVGKGHCRQLQRSGSTANTCKGLKTLPGGRLQS